MNPIIELLGSFIQAGHKLSESLIEQMQASGSIDVEADKLVCEHCETRLHMWVDLGYFRCPTPKALKRMNDFYHNRAD